MNHPVRWDEDNACVRLELIGEFSPEDAVAATNEMVKIYADKPRRYLLIDHTRSPKALSRETRAALEEHAPATDVERLAFFGMTNLSRVVARIIVALIGKSEHTKFFNSEAEALAWFRES